MYLVKELGKLEKMDKSMLIAQIFQLLQDVNSHEKSWYSNLREEENERKLDSVTNITTAWFQARKSIYWKRLKKLSRMKWKEWYKMKPNLSETDF